MRRKSENNTPSDRKSVTDPERNPSIYSGSMIPQRDGNDVLVPHLLVRSIPNFSDNKPVYAATDINGWLVSGKQKANEEALRLTTMTKEGNVWRARNMVGVRFHPSQILSSNISQPFKGENIGWAKIEKIYKLSDSFVDMSNDTPCLLVK